MQATAERDEQLTSLSFDLKPPVRAESIDLRALIGHRTATLASASVESVAEIFKTGSANFVAVLEGSRLLGMCSRQEIAALLGGRYGFSLWARRTIKKQITQLAELNEGHAYTYDRETLIKMLDEALAGSRPRTK